MRPLSVLRADDARLAHQAVPVVAAKRDQGAHGEASLAQAGAPDAPVERRHWHHALNDCGGQRSAEGCTSNRGYSKVSNRKAQICQENWEQL